jgi:alkylation response protein AidB-like acyl-CoA dehydrogenase
MTALAPTLGISAATLTAIAENAAALDAAPAFPHEAFEALAADGALGMTVRERTSRAREWAAVRAVAAADGSVGRLFEGHLNAAERIAVAAPEPLRSTELDAIREDRLKLGVWGADPTPAEGEPARLHGAGDGNGLALTGTKVFCSGAGGLDRALVLARGDQPGPPALAYVDLSRGTTVDRDWYRAGGMRASESHRVHFEAAPVLAILGEPGELSREPWFSRDAIRTAAAWAGMLDAAADAALADLGVREEIDDLRALGAGRIAAARATIDRWFEHAAAAGPDDDLRRTSVELREAVSNAGRTILDEAARACGSRPFATGTALDRARRDFELFVLQHRLDPMVARLGREAVRR